LRSTHFSYINMCILILTFLIQLSSYFCFFLTHFCHLNSRLQWEEVTILDHKGPQILETWYIQGMYLFLDLMMWVGIQTRWYFGCYWTGHWWSGGMVAVFVQGEARYCSWKQTETSDRDAGQRLPVSNVTETTK
jgi:hypothetical protein